MFSAIPFYYGTTSKAPNTFRITVELNDEIDGAVLARAAHNLEKAGLCHPGVPTVSYIQIPEDAYLKYSRDRDGNPAAITALLMARAIDRVHTENRLPIICGMAMNIRKVLGRPLSHHSLVSQLFLEYKESMKKMELRDQATCFRGMIMVQGQEENVWDSVRNNIRLCDKWIRSR